MAEPAVAEPAPAEPAAETWPAKAVQQPITFGSQTPAPWPGQAVQPGQAVEPGHQTPPASDAPAFGPPASQPTQPGQFPPGQFPPGQYGYGPQYFRPVAVRTNRAAIWALVCGIGQFVLGLAVVGNILAAIPAIVLGGIALRQIRLRGEGGRGLAIAGLVLGILGVVYFLLIVVVIIVGLRVPSGTS